MEKQLLCCFLLKSHSFYWNQNIFCLAGELQARNSASLVSETYVVRKKRSLYEFWCKNFPCGVETVEGGGGKLNKSVSVVPTMMEARTGPFMTHQMAALSFMSQHLREHKDLNTNTPQQETHHRPPITNQPKIIELQPQHRPDGHTHRRRS